MVDANGNIVDVAQRGTRGEVARDRCAVVGELEEELVHCTCFGRLRE